MNTTIDVRTGLCLAPSCPTPSLELGLYGFLCLDHALSMVAPAPPARTLVDLRGRCWGDGLTCHATSTTVTAHGLYCASHAPAQPVIVDRTSTPDEERMGQLAALAVMGAFPGSTISSEGPSLWATRSYGDSDEVQVIPAHVYPRTPARATTITLDDERVPRTARGMARGAKGWSVRLRAVDDPSSVVLRAWRGPLLVVACWTEGAFTSAWVQHSRGLPMRLQARQAGTLLKAAP